jgi:hypothetical protein
MAEASIPVIVGLRIEKPIGFCRYSGVSPVYSTSSAKSSLTSPSLRLEFVEIADRVTVHELSRVVGVVSSLLQKAGEVAGGGKRVSVGRRAGDTRNSEGGTLNSLPIVPLLIENLPASPRRDYRGDVGVVRRLSAKEARPRRAADRDCRGAKQQSEYVYPVSSVLGCSNRQLRSLRRKLPGLTWSVEARELCTLIHEQLLDMLHRLYRVLPSILVVDDNEDNIRRASGRRGSRGDGEDCWGSDQAG